MSTARILLAAIAGGAGVCLWVAAGQADPIALNVRPGLWKMTISLQNSGLPPALMARRQPHTYKSCMTDKSLQRGLRGPNIPRTCTQTIVSSSASTMDGRTECTSDQVSSRFHFDAPDPSTINGTVNVTVTEPVAGTGTMKFAIDGKWVSADCGGYAHPGSAIDWLAAPLVLTPLRPDQ
jgi:hypothetical protein